MSGTQDPVTREANLAKLEEEINACEAEIRHAAQKAEMAMDAGNERTFDYWAKREEQLRKEKEQLRKEKEQLRKKEEQLREEKKLLLMRQGQDPQVALSHRWYPSRLGVALPLPPPVLSAAPAGHVALLLALPCWPLATFVLSLCLFHDFLS